MIYNHMATAPLPQQPIENMHIEGFIPVIINVLPAANLPFLLGLNQNKDYPQDTDASQPPSDLTPAIIFRKES